MGENQKKRCDSGLPVKMINQIGPKGFVYGFDARRTDKLQGHNGQSDKRKTH